MVFQFKLPDIGEGVHEGEIVKWLVHEGQSVKEDQKIVEVMTDKATVEITSPRAGTIAKIHVAEGVVAKVGDVIVEIQEAGGAHAAPAAPAAAAKPAPAAHHAPPSGPGAAAAAGVPASAPAGAAKASDEGTKTLFDLETDSSSMFKSKRRAPAGAQESAPAGAQGTTAATTPSPSNGGKVLAAPALRREAREKGVDLARVAGSGPAGRVTRADFEQFLAAPAAAPHAAAKAPTLAPVATAAGDERVPIKGLRKAIYENMRRSKDHAAHFTYWDECDVTELVKLRKDASKLAEQMGVKLTYLPFIVKAVVAGLKQYRDINAVVDDEKRELVRRGDFNIGIATATERGLMVVVIKNADKKSIFEIAKEMDALSAKAREGKASPDDLKGSTFTITSLGKDGGLGATPVVNYPEVGILGVHKIEARAVVDPETRQVVVRDRMNLSSSFDHRLIDGHVGAAFVQHVIRLLSQPNLLLLGTA